MKKLLFGLLSVSALFAGVEKVIPLDNVPAIILEKAKHIVPEAKFTTANTETEKDYMVYEIQGVFSDGRKVEVDVLEDGEVEEVEVEFPTYMVPKAVLISIDKKYNGFKATYIEASHSASMKVIKYEFEGIYKDKKLDIEVSADGRRIVEADK